MTNTTESQNERVLSYLIKNAGITAPMAYKHIGTMRLAARVSDLRNQGYNIETQMIQHGKKRYAYYRLRQKTLAAMPA